MNSGYLSATALPFGYGMSSKPACCAAAYPGLHPRIAKTMAIELGPNGVRVNAIAPGLVDTRFAAAIVQNPMFSKVFTERAALHRYAQPPEIAGIAVYLASAESSFVTGQTMVIDGGYTIG